MSKLISTKQDIEKLVAGFGLQEKMDSDLEQKEKMINTMLESGDEMAIVMTFHSMKQHEEDKEEYKLDTEESVEQYFKDKGYGGAVGTEEYKQIVKMVSAGFDIADDIIYSLKQGDIMFAKLNGTFTELVDEAYAEAEKVLGGGK